MLPEDSDERALLRSRLLEIAAWCAHRLRVEDPAGCLRSDFLKPSLLTSEPGYQDSWNYEISDPISEVEKLCNKRAGALSADAVAKRDFDSIRFGRLLMFYPHETLCDGAANQSSNGYFDDWNIPPWDTWVLYTSSPDGRQVLYSWVPPEFVGLAIDGVSANPEECLEWPDTNWLAVLSEEGGRAQRDAHISESRYGAPE